MLPNSIKNFINDHKEWFPIITPAVKGQPSQVDQDLLDQRIVNLMIPTIAATGALLALTMTICMSPALSTFSTAALIATATLPSIPLFCFGAIIILDQWISKRAAESK